jgi:predicted RNase H-like nuclease (RuvC/YqgF family)
VCVCKDVLVVGSALHIFEIVFGLKGVKAPSLPAMSFNFEEWVFDVHAPAMAQLENQVKELQKKNESLQEEFKQQSQNHQKLLQTSLECKVQHGQIIHHLEQEIQKLRESFHQLQQELSRERADR